MKKQSFSLQTKLALFVSIILWSSAFVGIRISLTGYTPGSLALFRFLIAAICLYFICLYLPKRKKIKMKDKLILLFIGAITVGGYHVALNYGELSVSAGISSFIISQSPVFTTLLAIIFLKERINFLGMFGMLISIFGVSMILFGNPEKINFTIGSLYILISAFLGSVYSVVQKYFIDRYNAIEVTSYLVWGAAIILLLYSIPLSHEILQASYTATWSVIYLGIFPAAIAYLTWSHVLANMPASRAVNYLYWMPIIASFLGWIFLDEIPTLLSLLGGIIALLGVWVLNHSYKKITMPVMIEEQSISKN
ncbi:MAG: DMT family transporter [Gammaproteobacteria bacterium]|nr:DMT family transporter [Gammaproteobacteria bacterium]